MNTAQRDLIKRLVRVQQCLDINTVALHPYSRGTARAELDALVAEAGRLAAAQVTATERSRSQTAIVLDLRTTLRAVHLRPIIAIAGARIGRTRPVTGLKLPQENAAHRVHVNTAMSVAAILRTRKSVLLAEYLEADCLDKLVAAAQALAAGVVEADRCRGEIAANTGRIADVVRRGRALVRFLNALVTSKARRNKGLLAEWRRAAGTRPQKPVHRCAPVAPAPPDELPPGSE